MTAVAQALVSYLLTHPAACDSADGIAHWWFDLEDGVSPNELQRTLESLIERGLLESSCAADGRVRYRRRAELAMLRAYLESA
jgi:Fe2+ or Zn2+ uptake regulation protein